MKSYFVIIILIIIPLIARADSGYRTSPHGNRANLPANCKSCHKGHGLSKTKMLPAKEANLCFLCHGNLTQQQKMKDEKKLASHLTLKNIQSEFLKHFHHPIEKSDKQTNNRSDLIMGTSSNGVSCTDCHHHHSPKEANKNAVRGQTVKHSTRDNNQFEYQLCYRCHGRGNRSQSDFRNVEQEFDRNNPSFHPVETYGRNFNVPSLISPYTTASRINCSDCHASNDANGSKGPHGSIYQWILTENYFTRDNLVESPFNYAICYSCHSRTSILADQSFPYHRKHIVEVRTSCFTCHNSHGSSSYPHLIDFNPSVVAPDNKGRLKYRSLGRFRGECFLRCHGNNHEPKSY